MTIYDSCRPSGTIGEVPRDEWKGQESWQSFKVEVRLAVSLLFHGFIDDYSLFEI